MPESSIPSHRGSAPVLFIADLHLDPARPDMIETFRAFCAGPARAVQALYILGDLFEVWIGDDDDEPAYARVAAALAALTGGGVPVHFMTGNRDFLVGATFRERSGIRPIPDPHVLDLFGARTVLCHGDTLCTDDVEYQRFRARVRTPAWQRDFLARPLAERRQVAEGLRGDSRDAMSGKEETAMDVSGDAVVELLRAHGATRLIHGHTHRPGRHRHRLDGGWAERHVLADWYRGASLLVATAGEIRAVSLEEAQRLMAR